MGRPKGSVNTKSKTTTKSVKSKSIDTYMTKGSDKKEEEPKPVAVPILEAPLMIFVCRRCHSNFESTELYQNHNCPQQLFAIVESEETPEAIEEAETVKKPKSPQKKSPKKTATEATVESHIDENENEDVKEKKPRKPYKKRDKKEDESKTPIACESCGKTFTRKYHLERHLTHTQCNPGTFKKEEFNCEVCNKVFSRIDNLRMHLRAHLGQKSRSRGDNYDFSN